MYRSHQCSIYGAQRVDALSPTIKTERNRQVSVRMHGVECSRLRNYPCFGQRHTSADFGDIVHHPRVFVPSSLIATPALKTAIEMCRSITKLSSKQARVRLNSFGGVWRRPFVYAVASLTPDYLVFLTDRTNRRIQASRSHLARVDRIPCQHSTACHPVPILRSMFLT